jgi:pimeloyl-ACP methyl ester carboxylesterase
MTSPDSIRFHNAQGLELHANIWPNDGAPSCLLLHGFGHHSRIWDPLARHLQTDYQVLALDLRGHGDSDWDADRDYSHAALLQDLVALTARLELDNFHLVGHSLGARVAMLFAADYPQQVASLTIIDTGPEADPRGIRRIRMDAVRQPSTFANLHSYREWLGARHPLACPRGLQYLADHGVRQTGSHWLVKTDPAFVAALWQQDFASTTDDPGCTPLSQTLWQCLARTHCPTLVLKGQISSILRRDTAIRMVERCLARSELDVVPMAGHAVLLDNPEYCIAAISSFLGQDGQPRPLTTAGAGIEHSRLD